MTWRLLISSRSAMPFESPVVGIFARLSRFCVALALAAAGLSAGTVHGRFEIVSSQDPDVRKHSDYSGIVVWLEPIAGAPPAAPTRKKVEMAQKGKHFIPHVLAIEVGTTVDFPNYDPIFHNAFSNYDGQIFDVGLYPPGTSKTILFR